LSGTVCLLGILAFSTLVSWALTRPIARLGVLANLVDHPSSRRTRARAVPTTGGIVIFVTVALSLFLTERVCAIVSPEVASEMVTLLIGGAIVLFLGIVDDRDGLRPATKLAVQIAVAIERVRFLATPTIWLGWLKYPATVLWLVGFMNATNLIDGLDGLAGGIAAIGALGLVAVGILSGNPLLAILAAGLFGCTVGFLLHNFRKGDVYLGDGGSMLLGFFLAGGAVIGVRHDAASNALLVSAACMVVPAFDVATTILRRVRKRRGMMTPDRAHVHHRLIRFGLHPRAAVLVLWGVTVFFGGQMLGFYAPHGLIYIFASYGVAALVARALLGQQRKNLLTTERGPKQELAYLLGARDSVDSEEETDEMTLRQMLVAQLRREVAYRKIVRDGSRKRSAAEVPEGEVRSGEGQPAEARPPEPESETVAVTPGGNDAPADSAREKKVPVDG